MEEHLEVALEQDVAALCGEIWLVGDEGSAALVTFDETGVAKVVVGFDAGRRVDAELAGELSNGGELVAGVELAGRDHFPDAVDDLAVDGDAEGLVDFYGEVGRHSG
jgi:hypothetical protein